MSLSGKIGIRVLPFNPRRGNSLIVESLFDTILTLFIFFSPPPEGLREDF
jgi:hypothetical protein